MNYIIGSGLVAFVAKTLYPDYQIIPTGKSRYYRFQISTCDDYILCNKDIDEFMKTMASKIKSSNIPILFKKGISLSGQIISDKNEDLILQLINKIYKGWTHPVADKLLLNDGFVYQISSTDIFKQLELEHKSSFKDFIQKGDKLKYIDPNSRTIHTIQSQLEYTDIINTVPLDAMFKYCGFDGEFNTIDLHTFIVQTSELDFEGHSELYIADDTIDFFKCTRIGKNLYQFYSSIEITNLPAYLNLFIKKYDLVQATVVRKAIPIGDHKKHEELEQYGITSFGSNAQWDDFMDISSTIKRLVRYGSKCNK